MLTLLKKWIDFLLGLKVVYGKRYFLLWEGCFLDFFDLFFDYAHSLLDESHLFADRHRFI